MLQKKRDQFHKQIRKTHIQKIFQQRRKQFKNNINTQNKKAQQQIDDFFKHLKKMLVDSSASKIKYQNIKIINQDGSGKENQAIVNYFGLNQNIQAPNQFIQSNNMTTISEIIQNFQNFKSKLISNYYQAFTKYMMDKSAANNFAIILKDLVNNQEQSQQEDDQPVKHVQPKYQSVIRNYTIYQLVKLLDMVQYFAMGQIESVFIIIDSIWQLLTDDILFTENDDYAMLKHVLSILSKLIQDVKNESTYKYLKEKGIGNQLVKIIDRVRKFKISLQVYQNLFQMIDNYLSCQIGIGSAQKDKVGGITIQTYNVNQKQVLLAYCIAIIDKKQESLYGYVFECLSKIFELHQFLANTLSKKYLTQICDLILHHNRQMQNQSLNLINELTFHSQQNLETLLKDNYLFDILAKRLIIQKSVSDQFTTKNIQRVSYIICNSLLAENNKLKNACLQHYIWHQIDSSLHPSNKLFPLVMTMQYFFYAHGHKNFDRYLIPYLQALQSFEWQQCNYSKSIQDTIKRLFYNAREQWQQHQYVRFLKIMRQHKFFYLIEDYVEQQDIQLLDSIQTE